jgi:acetyl-CoA C-acetyltransferase
MSQAFIVAATRTAGARRGGRLRGWHPVDLAAAVLDEVVRRSGADPAAIDDVIMGCVSQAGEQSAQVGRSAVLASSLPDSVPAVTIDRQCGSSQQAIHFAAQAIMSGTQDLVIAAGVESMTRVPMGLPMAGAAAHGANAMPWPPSIIDRFQVPMFSQFTGAEMMARKYALSKDEMDAFALDSHRRAATARDSGAFDREILALDGEDSEGKRIRHDRDEGIRDDATLEGIASVKLLAPDGRLTAATASQICDGASAVLIASERAVHDHGLVPLARIHQMSVTAGDPVIMLEEPIPATVRALDRAGLSIDDIDLFEVNEAFASVPLAWLKATGADPVRTNVNGGAIALGHPLGATGTKLMTTLVHALRAQGKRYGLQTMCEGGGTANATIVEAL